MSWLHKKKVIPNITIEVSGGLNKPKRPPLPVAKGIDIGEDYKLLKTVYESNKQFGDLNTLKIIREVAPHADESTCPYCAVKHDFVAKRARKCPDCEKNMVVRNGVFLTEKQVERFEGKIQEFYDKQSAESRLENALRDIQSSQINKDLVRLYLGFAEGFRRAAKLDNQRDKDGFSFWDRAWRYYGQARREDANSSRYYSQQSSISQAMSETLIDEALSARKGENRNKTLKAALQYLLMSMGESLKFNDGMSSGAWVIERAKLIMKESSLTNDELTKISKKVVEVLRLNGAPLTKFSESVNAIKNYELFGSSRLFAY